MIHRSLVIAGLLSTLMCAAQVTPRSNSQETLVFEQSRNDWYQGYFAPVALSEDASWALVGSGSENMHLFSLPTGNEENAKLTGGLDSLDGAVFCGRGTPGLARLGHRGAEY